MVKNQKPVLMPLSRIVQSAKRSSFKNKLDLLLSHSELTCKTGSLSVPLIQVGQIRGGLLSFVCVFKDVKLKGAVLAFCFQDNFTRNADHPQAAC